MALMSLIWKGGRRAMSVHKMGLIDQAYTSKLWSLVVLNKTSGAIKFGVPQIVFFLSESPGFSMNAVRPKLRESTNKLPNCKSQWMNMHATASPNELNDLPSLWSGGTCAACQQEAQRGRVPMMHALSWSLKQSWKATILGWVSKWWILIWAHM